MAKPPLAREDLDHVLAHTRELWTEIRGQSVFITGGTGFFGMWLLESFCHANDQLKLGARAAVLTRDPAAFAAKAPHLAARSDLNFIAGDIRTFAFPSGRFPFVIHAATEASAKLNEESPSEMLDSIIGGTRHLLDFAAQAGTQKLLLTSSGAVYGPQPSDLTHVPETYNGAPDPLAAASAYGTGKRVAEHMCAVHARRFGYEVKIARCFAFVGPHLPLDAHFAIGNFLGDALNGRPIKVGGDGSPFRSYLYAADLAIWLWALLFRGTSQQALNVGSDQSLTIREVAHAVSKVAGGNVPVHIAREPVSGAPAARYVPATDRIRSALTLVETISFEESIRRTLAWHRAASTSRPAA
ncbi:MAG: NAD(P)-dependent oxidoreductase [Nibricoccus sp.]